MGLIAHYRLDGDARDSVGNNHGTYSSVSWVDGKLGKAGNFTPGVGNGVWIPHDNYLSSKVFGVGTTLSFSFWINLHQYSNYGIVIGKQSGGGYDESTSSVWVTGSGIRLVLGTNEPNSVGKNKNVAITPSLNEWHHVAFTSDGSTMRAYLDGYLEAQETYWFSRPRSENTSDFQIGTPRVSGRNEGIDGQIQDVRIYDHALSPREVRDLSLGLARRYSFEGDDLLDYAGGEIVHPSTPVPSIVGAGPSGLPAYQFDGSTQYLDTGDTIPFIRGDAAFSLTAWVWLDSEHGSGTSGGSIIGHADTTGFGMQVFGRKINFGYRWTSNFTGGTALDLGRWYHVSCVREKGGDCYIYLNGNLDGSDTNTLRVRDTTEPVQIGYSAGRMSYLHGRLSDVRIYATALTAAQVKELYQQKASIDSEGSVHTPLLDVGIPYVSEFSSSEVGFMGSASGFPVSGDTDPCSGLVTFQQALDYAKAQGGRLPTRAEMAAGVTAGTGCGYDTSYCWTCEKGDDETEHWVSFGNHARWSAGPDYILSNDQTAVVRFVADDDLDRPDPTVINDALIREWLFT